MVVGRPVLSSIHSAKGTSNQSSKLMETLAIRPVLSAGPGMPIPMTGKVLSGSKV